MKAITVIVFAGILGLSSVSAQDNSCRTGKLVGFDTKTQVVEGFRTEHYEEKTNKNGKKVTDGYSYGGTQTQVTYVLTVAVGEMTYAAEHPKALVFGYNPTDMIVNDPVNVRVEKNKLVFLRPNGKEYKTTIVRVERNPGLATQADIPPTGVVAAGPSPLPPCRVATP